MKKYETLWLCVTTFDKEDVVTASVVYNTFESGVGVNAGETWWNEG